VATSSNAAELGKRRGRPPKSEGPTTFAADFAASFFPALHASFGIRFPSPIYRADPVRFSREILGVEPWSKQVEILEAVRDNPRVAVASGHKCGKSHSVAQLVLWFYCSYDAARAVMTSTTSRQVDEILWREVRMVHARSGRCLACKAEIARNPGARIPRPCPHSSLIDGELADLARTGLRSDDFREVVGFTAKQAEAVAGISGENVLYVVDEASGVAQEIYEAIEGNRAGSARLLLLGNPTKNSGEFYDAFHSKERFYKTITVSSESTPNVVTGRKVIPGLATREWVEEKADEWGRKSSLFKVRVLGEFAEHEEGKIFSLHTIEEAEKRWAETPAAGRLYIGLDPAGEKGSGDEIVFAPRRGLKLLELDVRRGLDEQGHLVALFQVIKKHRTPRETPVVVVDRGGSVGVKVWRALRDYADAHPNELEVVGVNPSDKSMRQPELYDRMRDALAASLASWVDAGGALVEDTKLAKELHALEWKQRVDGRLKLTDKVTLRKMLGRSPDRFDAISLSTWEPLALREQTGDSSSSARDYSPSRTLARDPFDPYRGADIWERR
jgi:phage terminase large subunit